MLCDKYEIECSQEIIQKTVRRLTNQLWKLIPMRENDEDWYKQLPSSDGWCYAIESQAYALNSDGSIKCNLLLVPAQVRIIFPVFSGISGSYKTILIIIYYSFFYYIFF